MNCWKISLRAKAKSAKKMKEFKSFVKSDELEFDFQNIIPIPELLCCSNQTDKNKLYLMNWNTFYPPTQTQITEETSYTIWYQFHTDQVPLPILTKLSNLFPNIKFDMHAELDKKLILGGGKLRTVYRFNYLEDKNFYELRDYSWKVYEEEILNIIDILNKKNSATKFEIEELEELTTAYYEYKNVPDKIKFLQKIYEVVCKFPRIQCLLDTAYPGAFRKAKVKIFLSGLRSQKNNWNL